MDQEAQSKNARADGPGSGVKPRISVGKRRQNFLSRHQKVSRVETGN